MCPVNLPRWTLSRENGRPRIPIKTCFWLCRIMHRQWSTLPFSGTPHKDLLRTRITWGKCCKNMSIRSTLRVETQPVLRNVDLHHLWRSSYTPFYYVEQSDHHSVRWDQKEEFMRGDFWKLCPTLALSSLIIHGISFNTSVQDVVAMIRKDCGDDILFVFVPLNNYLHIGKCYVVCSNHSTQHWCMKKLHMLRDKNRFWKVRFYCAAQEAHDQLRQSTRSKKLWSTQLNGICCVRALLHKKKWSRFQHHTLQSCATHLVPIHQFT